MRLIFQNLREKYSKSLDFYHKYYVAKKKGGFWFCLLSYLVGSQIWLNYLLNDLATLATLQIIKKNASPKVSCLPTHVETKL